MSLSAGVAFVDIRPNLQKFQSDLKGKVEGAFKGVGKTSGLALAAAGTAAIAGLGAVIKTGLDEVKDYQAGLAQANAVIKSTGGVAGVTAKHIEELASSIQKQTGLTDDSVVASENLLLTFTQVRNEAGRGNDIFDQSIKVLGDMSVALGQDAKSSAIQLGKALNDPIKGVTALQRVGVSFTEAQKKQIKKLVETGHTLEAQKLILKELNTEFGGSAKAFGQTLPGKIAKAKRSFEDLSQNLVQSLVPVFEAIVKGLTFVTDHFEAFGPIIAAVIAGFIAYKVTALAVAAVNAVLGTSFELALGPIGLIVAALTALAIVAFKFRGQIIGAIKGLASALAPIWQGIVTAIKAVGSFFLATWNLIVGIAKRVGPILLALFTGPFGLILTNAFGFRDKILRVFGFVRDGIVAAFRGAKNLVVGIWNGMVLVIKASINALLGIIEKGINLALSPARILSKAPIIGRAIPDVPEIHIPRLAEGGRVLKTGLAIVDRGEVFSGVGNGFGNQTINVTVNVQGALLGSSQEEVAKTIRKALLNLKGRNGPLGLA